MRVIGLIGEPATGKTTVMRAVLAGLNQPFTEFKFKLVVGRMYPNDLYVLGIYRDQETFGGTDRLSMAVQPYAIRFLRKVPPAATILYEGDRLTRAGFFEEAAKLGSLTLFLLETGKDEKAKRHQDRQDTQPDTFTRSRATLMQKIAQHYPVTRLRNEGPRDIEACAAQVLYRIQYNG